jgi:hypothetical protein
MSGGLFNVFTVLYDFMAMLESYCKARTNVNICC